ncbi:MAG: peroxidase family protein [Ilumatobacteraceae bacterium]
MSDDPVAHRLEPTTGPTATRSSRRALALALPVLLAGVGCTAAVSSDPASGVDDGAGEAAAGAVDDVDLATLLADARSLDGSGNHLDDPTIGQAGTVSPRDAPANYADGIAAMVDGPDARYLSNRIFNDSNQNVFSEAGVTHWGFVWGQFIDHTIGLRESGDEKLQVPFSADDPLESFTNDLGGIAMTRSAAADGTGDDTPREQINTLSSYIDGWAVYGGSDERLDWLRAGTVDGDPTNNSATLLNDDGYLPTATSRPGVDVPPVDLMGQLFGDPTAAVVAGDVRANENIGLTAVQTLFLREHNRIVEALPDTLDEETKFQIARRVIGGLQQYITYTEFLPSLGVDLPEYTGFDSTVDPSITNEFATVGYRAHSQIHGEFEAEIDRVEITDDQIDALEAGGVEVAVDDDTVEVAVPLAIAFGNPGLLTQIGLGNLLTGLASEAEYANDEQIDNQLRSVLFQIPGPDVEDPMSCLDGPAIAGCFSAVNDLGALDVMRGYDHGMPTYNELRVASGLAPVGSFAELTGEATDELPDGLTIDDPEILDFVSLADVDGNALQPGSDAADTLTVHAERRTTTAARLRAVFGDVATVDAFTGMVSEPHVDGTEFGELQLAMWTRQFTALRDGDRFFYANDPALDAIAEEYGIDYRMTLADVIAANTDVDGLPDNVFLLDAMPTVTDVAATTVGDGAGSAADDPEVEVDVEIPDSDTGPGRDIEMERAERGDDPDRRRAARDGRADTTRRGRDR